MITTIKCPKCGQPIPIPVTSVYTTERDDTPQYRVDCVCGARDIGGFFVVADAQYGKSGHEEPTG
jgi:hypothetical protein